MEPTEKTINRLRKRLNRIGHTMHTDRTFGGYMIMDLNGRHIVAGSPPNTMGLEAVENWIKDNTGPKTIEGITYYTIGEAADFLGVAKNTIRNYLAAGKLKGYQFGRPILIKETDLKNMIKPYRSAE